MSCSSYYNLIDIDEKQTLVVSLSLDFMQNMFLSSCPRYDGSQMPKKGVLKTSPLPPARDLSSSDHPVSSKMALSVKGRRTKAVDWVVI